jgi:hypothetical protein
MLTRVWDQGIKPAFEYMKAELFPRVTELTQRLAAVWQEKVVPALERAGIQLEGDFIPALGDFLVYAIGLVITNIEYFIDVLEWLEPAIVSVIDAVAWVIDLFTEWRRVTADLMRSISNLSLPPWLTPGSPTPLELGVRGINDAMDEMARKQLPSLSRGFGIANPLQPAVAGAGAAGGGGGELIRLEVPVILDGREVGYGAIEGTLEALRQRGKTAGGDAQG